MGKQGADLVVRNRELLFGIFKMTKQSSAMDFKLGGEQTLDRVDFDHFNRTSLMRLRGCYETKDGTNEIHELFSKLAQLKPMSVSIDLLKVHHSTEDGNVVQPVDNE